MRKIILLPVVIIFSVAKLSAQVEKNQVYPGISFQRGLSYFNASYGITPSISFGLSEHSLVSISANYTRNKNYSDQYFTGYSKEYEIGIGYTYLHYFRKNGKWGWFANASLTWNQAKLFDTKNDITIQSHRTSLGITPGIFFKPSSGILLYADIGGVDLLKGTNGLRATSSFGRQVNVGVLFQLGKKKK